MGHRRTVILLAAFLAAMNCKQDYTLTKKDIQAMQERFIFNQNGKKAYMPLIYGMKDYVFTIFSVPGKNRVGTLELDDALTFMEFRGEEIKYNEIASKYCQEYDRIVGDRNFRYSFSLPYSDNDIFYGQNAWCFRVNIKNGTVERIDLNEDLDEHISRVECIDSEKNLFVFEVLIPNSETDLKALRIVKIDNSITRLGEIPAGIKTSAYDQPWELNNDLIFTYDSSANKLKCNNLELKAVSHPFIEIFNRNSGTFRKLKEFIIHPTLPFGIVVEIGKDLDWEKLDSLPPTKERELLTDSLLAQASIHALYLIRWDTDEEKNQFVPIFTEPASAIANLHPKAYSNFQLSPDNKWMVFRDETQYQPFTESDFLSNALTSEQNPVFIALPIDEKNPMYFGVPLFLGKVLREKARPESNAWVQKPVSFVVSDGLALYKWELETIKTAHLLNTPNDVVKTK